MIFVSSCNYCFSGITPDVGDPEANGDPMVAPSFATIGGSQELFVRVR